MSLIFALAFFVLSLLCFFVPGAENPKAARRFGFAFLVLSLGILAAGLLGGEDAGVAVSMIGLAALILAAAGMLTADNFRCTEEVEAQYLRSKPMSGGRGYIQYAPVFRYYFGGQYYEAQTKQSFSEGFIKSNLEPALRHTIYVDLKDPKRIQYRRRSNLLLWILGAAFLAMGLTVLFSPGVFLAHNL